MKPARWILVYGRSEGLAFVFMLIHLYDIVVKIMPAVFLAYPRVGLIQRGWDDWL